MELPQTPVSSSWEERLLGWAPRECLLDPSVAQYLEPMTSGVRIMLTVSSQIITTVFLIPLRHRPKTQGLFGAVFGVASISGPLIGGGFTSNVSWRWCFYINLPIGGVAFLACALWMKVPNKETTGLPLSEKIKKLDLIGTAIFVPCVMCLLLALQMGGTTYAVSRFYYSI